MRAWAPRRRSALPRAWVIWTVSAMALLAVVSAPAPGGATPPATWDPAVTFRPVDLTGNGLFEFLNASVTLNVSVGGTYSLGGNLLTPGGSEIEDEGEQISLSPGSATQTLSYHGPLIRSAGVDGPYLLSLTAVLGTGPTSEFRTQQNVTTPAYRAAQFEPFWITIGGPVAAQPVNPDPEGLYGDLVVQVPLYANRTSSVNLYAALDAPRFLVPIEVGAGPTLVPGGSRPGRGGVPRGPGRRHPRGRLRPGRGAGPPTPSAPPRVRVSGRGTSPTPSTRFRPSATPRRTSRRP